jgi:hypothetical protein
VGTNKCPTFSSGFLWRLLRDINSISFNFLTVELSSHIVADCNEWIPLFVILILFLWRKIVMILPFISSWRNSQNGAYKWPVGETKTDTSHEVFFFFFFFLFERVKIFFLHYALIYAFRKWDELGNLRNDDRKRLIIPLTS